MTEAAHRFAKDHLKAFIERVERLEEEKKALSDDIRDVFAEAKGNGFDVKAMREIIRRRKMDSDELAERDAILDAYMIALGMAPEPPRSASSLAQEMADEGLISQKTADETKAIEVQIRNKFGADRAQACAAHVDNDFRADPASPLEGSGSPVATESACLKSADGMTAGETAPIASSSPDLGQAGDADRPRPGGPSHSNRQGADAPDATGGADDLDRIPDILRRDADNVAPFMKTPPSPAAPTDQPRAPP